MRRRVARPEGPPWRSRLCPTRASGGAARLLVVLGLFALVTRAAVAATPGVGSQGKLDDAARAKLAATLRHSRDFVHALYQSAWLTWLAPRKYAEPAENTVLRDQRLRDAAADASDPVSAALVATVDAWRDLTDTCTDGTVTAQGERLERDLAADATHAEAAQSRLGEADPVVRMALANLYLSWDDVLALQADAHAQDRKLVLRRAVSAAEAAAAIVPGAPGPYRTLATARSRLAGLDNDPQQWDLAISAATHASSLDPTDRGLWELLWTLTLRAGHWAEAKHWEAKCEGTAP